MACETLKGVTKVHVSQEIANRNAAVGAAKLAHAKIRAEAYPEPGAIRRSQELEQGEPVGGLNAFHKAAIVALLIGAIGGLLGSQSVLTLGAAAAAILLLLGLSGLGAGRGRGAAPKPIAVARSPPREIDDRSVRADQPRMRYPPAVAQRAALGVDDAVLPVVLASRFVAALGPAPPTSAPADRHLAADALNPYAATNASTSGGSAVG